MKTTYHKQYVRGKKIGDKEGYARGRVEQSAESEARFNSYLSDNYAKAEHHAAQINLIIGSLTTVLKFGEGERARQEVKDLCSGLLFALNGLKFEYARALKEGKVSSWTNRDIPFIEALRQAGEAYYSGRDKGEQLRDTLVKRAPEFTSLFQYHDGFRSGPKRKDYIDAIMEMADPILGEGKSISQTIRELQEFYQLLDYTVLGSPTRTAREEEAEWLSTCTASYFGRRYKEWEKKHQIISVT